MPRVSVIIPVHDRAALLSDALDALDAQEYRDFEVVVVDDRSNDAPAAVAKEHAARGLPVRVIANPGVGAVQARIAGVQAAVGEILAFTDSDCRPDVTWLKAGIAAIEGGADLVNGPTVSARPSGPLEHTVESGAEGLYPTCNLFVRREAYDAAGGFDTTAARRLGFRPSARLRGLGFGEDTLLAWTIIRRTQPATWAADARVVHAVMPTSWRDRVGRAWLAGSFPALAREIPELRAHLLTQGVLLGTRRLPLYAVILAGAAGRRRAAMVGLVGWVASRAWTVGRQPGSVRGRVRALPVELAVDLITAAALTTGSARTGSVVL